MTDVLLIGVGMLGFGACLAAMTGCQRLAQRGGPAKGARE